VSEGGAQEPSARVVALREQAFLRSGFPPRDAERLARDGSVDFLAAVSLVKAGFPAEVAAGMLASGARPVF
jgi:hypothetical protein